MTQRGGIRGIATYQASLMVAVLTSASAGASGGGAPLQLTIDDSSPRYVAHARSADGEYALRLLVRPVVRSIRIIVRVPPLRQAGEHCVVFAELLEWPLPAGRRPVVVGQATVVQQPEGAASSPTPRWTAFSSTLKPREQDITWLLRLRTEPGEKKTEVPPLGARVEIEADARPITEREKQLMAWRATVDPLKQPDLVRAKIMELTDDEVQYYTAFKDRATFLKYWLRKLDDIPDAPRDEEGKLKIGSALMGLVVPGNALPDGQYIHHNGKVPPLE